MRRIITEVSIKEEVKNKELTKPSEIGNAGKKIKEAVFKIFT